MLTISDELVTLGNPGNNGDYDDYYFKTVPQRSNDKRMQVNPGSTYYYKEEINGEKYTNILLKNRNNPAKFIKNYVQNLDLYQIPDEYKNEIKQYLADNVYIPTLPELVKVINQLEPGEYWTSSVIKQGSKNIILKVNPDQVLTADSPTDKAKVIAFFKI